jgi:hypothetical protein
MEQKKNKQVNLEDEKKTSFLLGLVFVLSLLFVALEFNHVPESLTYDENIIDELAQDLEMVSTLEKDDIRDKFEKQVVVEGGSGIRTENWILVKEGFADKDKKLKPEYNAYMTSLIQDINGYLSKQRRV